MGPFVLVAGARPNFVKVAPILYALEARAGAPPCELVHTGQHYDAAMSGVFFEQLGIREPAVHLQIGSASHGVQTGKIMLAFDEYLAARANPPVAVVVVGDVNSTMACALVSAKRQLPVVHVEAGLRSFDRSMPEEINRIVTDAVSERLLVSEPSGLQNLANEGVAPARTRYVGNVMIDTLVEQLPAARALQVSNTFGVARMEYVVVTLHRPENVDSGPRLAALVGLVARLSEHIPIVFPMHPRTAARLAASDLSDRLRSSPRMHVCPPLGYREFLSLVADARAVVTDSGGLQEETTYLGVPCVTLRTSTERPITVTQGTNVLAGEDLEAAFGVITSTLDNGRTPRGPIDGWDGKAATRVADALLELV